MYNFSIMKDYFLRYKKYFIPGAFLAILAGLVLILAGLNQSVVVVVDGEAQTVRTPALTVAGVLRAADVSASNTDRVIPSRGRLIWNPGVVRVETARDVIVRTPDFEVSFRTAEPIPANILGMAETALFPQDTVRVNGEAVDPGEPIERAGTILVQLVPAVPITLISVDGELVIHTDQPTLGAALEAASIPLAPEDWLSEDLDTALTGPMSVTLRWARPVTVEVSGGNISGLSAGTTVGEALQDLGIPLQNLDYSDPDEDAVLPEDGRIRIVRVGEDLTISTEEFTVAPTYELDPETPLDQTSVIDPGQMGIYATRERIIYHGDEEIWRHTEDRWQASEPEAPVHGIGSRIVEITETVGGETITYYRKIVTYFHTYKPCIPGTDICSYSTASGLPLDKGIIAVSLAWYRFLQGQRVFIPGYGYGVIADTCGFCAGRNIIDLGYAEEGYYEQRLPNSWTTVYFLTPAPDYVPIPFPFP